MECNVNRRFGEERNSERVKGGYLTASSGENVYVSALEQAEDYICDNAELLAALDIREVALSMLKPLGMGEHNKNFWFAHPTTGEKFVLRVNVASQPFHDDQVAYEFVALEALAKSGRVPRPVYLDNSSAALGKGVLVESFCEGDIDLALELHEWNISLGKVLMGDIAHFEVAIRNAYNRVLEENFKSDKHWLLDESSPVVRPILRNSKTKKLRDVNLMNRKAISDAERRAHDPTDPDV